MCRSRADDATPAIHLRQLESFERVQSPRHREGQTFPIMCVALGINQCSTHAVKRDIPTLDNRWCRVIVTIGTIGTLNSPTSSTVYRLTVQDYRTQSHEDAEAAPSVASVISPLLQDRSNPIGEQCRVHCPGLQLRKRINIAECLHHAVSPFAPP